jgi:quinol monooxygenase YgiN
MSVKLIALLHSNTDAEDTFELELKKLVEASVKEEGCLQYELYQFDDERCHYVIMEEWKDEASLKLHHDTPHYKNFGRVAPVLLSKPVEVKMLTRLA